MRFNAKRLLVLLMIAFSTIAFSQNTTQRLLRGTVKDEKGALLQSITVTEKGTKNAVMTNAAGSYSITVKPNAILVFTGVGLEAQEVKASGNGDVNVTLSFDSKSLSDVVVVGYGSQKKANL